MLDWLSRFNICCFLDNHHYKFPGHEKECLAGAGCISAMPYRGNFLLDTGAFIRQHNDWIFGHLGYELKNEIELAEGEQIAQSISNRQAGQHFKRDQTNTVRANKSSEGDRIGFADAFLFVPEYVLMIEGNVVNIGSLNQDHETVYGEILANSRIPTKYTRSVVQERTGQEEYVAIVNKLKDHILRGDCYEINFCHEYFAEHAQIDPVETYCALSSLSPNPFSAFYRVGESYLLCASPERFLKKTGQKIISQPIKGTAPRDLLNKEHDAELKKQLSVSQKERSENVMIVDLVRNDLSKICVEGSVHVDELFGVYEFPQVYQMISTVSGMLRNGVDFEEIIRASFPMGSMTGAPKKRVMELIDEYEKSRRGIFSGAVGYISPEKDFDFNVVIRSILYNASEQYLSFQVGSGITFYSDAEKEYRECQWKASAIKNVLGSK